jgi:hypothetical protein
MRVSTAWRIVSADPHLIVTRHTFGGVQHAAFPNVVPKFYDPNDTLSVAHFDSTFVHFDNNM